jgi:hypothetical protein
MAFGTWIRQRLSPENVAQTFSNFHIAYEFANNNLFSKNLKLNSPNESEGLSSGVR